MPAYTTLERVKTNLGIDLAATTDDYFLNYNIQSVSKLIETLTGRTFNVRLYDLRVEQPFGFRRFQLPHTPVISVEEIKFKGQVLDPTTYTIEDADAGFLIRVDGASWPSTTVSSNNVTGTPYGQPIGLYEVQWTGGFADIPFDIEDAVVQQVSFQYYKRGRDPSVKGISVLGDSISYAGGMENQYHPAFSAAVSRWTKVPVL
jgi:hypothetical protein